MEPIIDVCGAVYDVDCWRVHLRTFADLAPGYLRFFGPAFTAHAGADPDRYDRALRTSPYAAIELLIEARGLGLSEAEHVDMVRAQGIRHQVLHGAQAALPGGDTVNDRVARRAAAHPELFTAWAGLDPARPDEALRELERCVELGMRGAAIVHFVSGADPDSPGCHRIYARLAELGLPLWLHTGTNLAANRPITSCTWQHVDRIAGAHPELTVLGGHGGWPWVLEGIAVMQRHPNVFLEFSAHRPRVMAKPGSGWEPLLLFGRSVLRHRVLFGSAGFVHRQSLRELADEIDELNLGAEAARAWRHDNAAALLRLPELAATGGVA
ncbi:amidohydrolase family protein [Amycolatopsis anabasis]|uniref:amidohydrolase family protein n=1 Tax=Amycolatopsis anabasis TaxID=1840409 RepID=UPI00131DE2DF|nr:amidohydrolase family protein [Amycolatopsis anabasis]